jgi:hypothetical protein
MGSVGMAGHPSAGADPNAYGLVNEIGTLPAASMVQEAPSWFYAHGKTHQGPVRLLELQQMAANGQVGPNTMVWTNGMPAWIPAHQAPGLNFPVPSIVQGSSSAETTYNAGQAILAPSLSQFPPRTSGLAVASLVLGILWICGLGSLLATIFGAVALSQISRSRGTIGGKGLAIAGLVLGILGLSLFALSFFTSYVAAVLDQAQGSRP